MGSANELKESTITVDEILSHCRRWGIPHFQRGSVWSTDNVAALFESLFYDTPCGSIILWEQANPRFGVPLFKGETFSCLVIDGQQRIRSLMAGFKEIEDITTGENDENGNDGQPTDDSLFDPATVRKVWAINLDRLNWVNRKLPLHRRQRNAATALFSFVADPGEAERRRREREEKRRLEKKKNFTLPQHPFKFNCVPLRYLLDEHTDYRALLEQERIFLKRRDDGRTIMPSDPDGDAAIELLAGLGEQVRRMRGRSFFLRRLPEEDGLDGVIRVFIRINSGGRPVREEEKAFAALVQKSARDLSEPSASTGSTKTANEWLDEIFQLVHPNREHPSPHQQLGRDATLARLNEREFGFKMFIRLYVLASAYHVQNFIGKTSFSFNVLRDTRFEEIHRKGNDGAIWSVVMDVTLAVKELLEDLLHLDSLRFLPSIRPLIPVFVALIRYPDLLERSNTPHVRVVEGFRDCLAAIALGLLLKEPSERVVMGLASRIASDQRPAAERSAGVCLDGIRADATRGVEEKLREGLRYANSLSSRYTRLLYGLERWKGAKDFSYKINGLEGPQFDGEERMIDRHCMPERQHIIPYSLLKIAYNIAQGARVSNSPANNIGNITYMSHDMNTLGGLGEKLLELWDEPPGNLASHFLDRERLAGYLELKQFLEQDSPLEPRAKDFKTRYEAWIKIRQHEIAHGFMEWLSHFEGSWATYFEHSQHRQTERIEPAKPLLFTVAGGLALAHRLREFDLPDPVEDALIDLFAREGWRKTGDNSIELQLDYRPGGRTLLKGVLISSDRVLVPALADHGNVALNAHDVMERIAGLRIRLDALIQSKRSPKNKVATESQGHAGEPGL